MIIFISPAKGFSSVDRKPVSTPVFIDEAKTIMNTLSSLSTEDISNAMKVKDNIAQLNKERFSDFKFDSDGQPALLTYDGMQYKNIKAFEFSDEDIDFAMKHLRILSALYGVLKPLDSIYPYRLDFLTKLKVGDFNNMYNFWNDKIYSELSTDSDGVIVNLASDEYSKAVKKYLEDEKYITCTFKVNKNGTYKVQSTASKKARGMMVNYIIKNKITDFRKLVDFSEDGYTYSFELSSEDEFIFVKD